MGLGHEGREAAFKGTYLELPVVTARVLVCSCLLGDGGNCADGQSKMERAWREVVLVCGVIQARGTLPKAVAVGTVPISQMLTERDDAATRCSSKTQRESKEPGREEWQGNQRRVMAEVDAALNCSQTEIRTRDKLLAIPLTMICW